MEQDIFIKLLNLSYQGGIAICIIILARFLLHIMKAPKKYAYYLWLLAFVRLVLPFSFESVFSILPEENEPIRTAIVYEQIPEIHTGSAVVNQVVNNVLPKATPYASVNPMQIYMMVAEVIWFIGIGIFGLVSIISFIRLRKRLVGSARYMQTDSRVYISDYIETAFVLGFFKPRIYVSSTIGEREMSYIIMHERAHIKRKDDIVKLLLFGITILHWYNPLVWLAYVLAIQDMEMSCDEYVMKNYAMREYDGDIRKEYATSLLSLAVGRKLIWGTPLAFGEGNVKGRIKNVAKYKKPLISVAICAVIGCIILGFALLSNPVSTNEFGKVVKEVGGIEEDKIDSIVVHMLDEKNTFSVVYADEFITFFKSLEVKKKISKSRDANIEKEISIIITSGGESKQTYAFHIADEAIWFDNGIKASYWYKIVNYKEVEDFLQKVYESVTETLPEENEKSETDGNVSEEGNVVDGNSEQTGQGMEEISVPVVTIDANASLGADGAMLDYADGSTVIFHGYFGLFVYDLSTQNLVRAVDLAAIGCDSTQGDLYCEVSVSEDGRKVYLHPMSSSEMYVFNIESGKLYKTTYNMEGIVLFDKLTDNSALAGSGEGFYSIQKVVFGTGEESYKGYLYAYKDTIGELSYAESDMIYMLFDSINGEGVVLDGVSLSVKEESVTPSGANFSILNTTDKEITCGEDYFLQYYENGKWYVVPYSIDNFGFNSIGYIIEKNEPFEITVDWEWLYGKLESGKYRMVKEVLDFRAAGDFDKYMLMVEFEVK